MILSFLQLALLLLLAIQIIFGGFYIPMGAKSLSLVKTDVPGILFLLTLIPYLLKKETSKSILFLENLYQKLTNLKNPVKVTLIFIIGLLILFTLIHSMKHLSFKTHGYDMAFVNQSIFYPFGKNLLNCDVCLNKTYFGEHISWIFFILSPLVFFKSNYILFFVQSLTLLFPIYFFIRYVSDESNKKYALILLIIFLTSRTFKNNFYWDLREDNFTFLFLSLMLISYHLRNFKAYILSLFASLICKENVSLVTLFFSFYIFLDNSIPKNEKLKFTLTTIILSITYLIITFGYFIPQFTIGKQSEQVILLRFGKYGKTPKDVLINMITTPSIWWELIKNNLFTIDRIKYVLVLGLPFFYFIKKDLKILFPILVGLSMNLLPELNSQRMMIFHYDLIILPFLFYVTVNGFNQSNDKIKKTILLVSICLSGSWPLANFKEYFPDLNDIKNSYFLSKLDDSKIIASNFALLSHFTDRKTIRSLGEGAITTIEELHQPQSKSLHQILEADLFILDTKNPNDLKTYTFLSSIGFTPHSESSDHRFIILEKTGVTKQ